MTISSPDAPDPEPHKARRRGLAAVLVGVALGAAVWFGWPALHAQQKPATGAGRGGPSAAAPVVAPQAQKGEMAQRLLALGTVTARNTAVVRVQAAGRLERLYFQEGQMVQAGQLLAQIDPRAYQVQLDSANAALAKDQAQLVSAEQDLVRYKTLLAQDSIASQQVDTQAALVSQLKAAIGVDRAAIAQAQLLLSYARVTAPIGGRVGLKQVDLGNMLAPTDTNGIVVITQVQPIGVVFSVPQPQLPDVLSRLRDGAALAVEAWDAGNKKLLATGTLASADNQVDVTTGTVKLKAEFDNQDGALFPNQFVNIRLTVHTLEDAVLVPVAAVQQGASGPFVFVAGDDDTVAMRPVSLGPGDGAQVAVLRGVQAGERVVTDGVDRIRDGMKVQVAAQRDVPVAASRSASAPGAHPRRSRKGTDAAAASP
jgi:membrane fusion protein, multidrug efflux system